MAPSPAPTPRATSLSRLSVPPLPSSGARPVAGTQAVPQASAQTGTPSSQCRGSRASNGQYVAGNVAPFTRERAKTPSRQQPAGEGILPAPSMDGSSRRGRDMFRSGAPGSSALPPLVPTMRTPSSTSGLQGPAVDGVGSFSSSIYLPSAASSSSSLLSSVTRRDPAAPRPKAGGQKRRRESPARSSGSSERDTLRGIPASITVPATVPAKSYGRQKQWKQGIGRLPFKDIILTAILPETDARYESFQELRATDGVKHIQEHGILDHSLSAYVNAWRAGQLNDCLSSPTMFNSFINNMSTTAKAKGSKSCKLQTYLDNEEIAGRRETGLTMECRRLRLDEAVRAKTQKTQDSPELEHIRRTPGFDNVNFYLNFSWQQWKAAFVAKISQLETVKTYQLGTIQKYWTDGSKQECVDLKEIMEHARTAFASSGFLGLRKWLANSLD